MIEIKIEISTKPYIKRYLQDKFGPNVAITRGTEIGKYFFSLLERNVRDDDGNKYFEYKTKVSVTLSESVYFRYGYIITRTGMRDFNIFVEYLIKRDLRNWVSASICGARMTGQKLMVAKAIRQFAEAYNFDESSFPFDTMKKDYDRWRGAKRKNECILRKKESGNAKCL
jgi:hypothetical protein